MSSKAVTRRPLSPTVQARQNVLANVLADVAAADLGIAKASQRGVAAFMTYEEGLDFYKSVKDLPREALEAKGWASLEELRIAIHALNPSKEAPYALTMAQRRAELRWRDGSGENPGEKAKGYAIPVAPPRKKAP